MQTTDNDALADWMLIDAASPGFDIMATPETPPLLRLPPELLSKILEHALGGHILAFPRRTRQPQPNLLPVPQHRPAAPVQPQRTAAAASSISSANASMCALRPPGPAPPPPHLLGALLTSRALYAAALPVLYATSDFAIDTSALFNNAPPSAAATHLPSIRALHLDTRALGAATALLAATPAPVRARLRRLRLSCCGRPGRRASAHLPHGAAWRGLWGAVAGLRGLRRVDVFVCGHDVPPGWQRAVLEPVAEGCRGMEAQVCVFVAWDAESVSAQRARGWGFEIRRYAGDDG